MGQVYLAAFNESINENILVHEIYLKTLQWNISNASYDWDYDCYHMTGTMLSYDWDYDIIWLGLCYHMTGTMLSYDWDYVIIWLGLCYHMTGTMLSYDWDYVIIWLGLCYHMTGTMLSYDWDYVIIWLGLCYYMTGTMLSLYGIPLRKIYSSSSDLSLLLLKSKVSVFQDYSRSLQNDANCKSLILTLFTSTALDPVILRIPHVCWALATSLPKLLKSQKKFSTCVQQCHEQLSVDTDCTLRNVLECIWPRAC